MNLIRRTVGPSVAARRVLAADLDTPPAAPIRLEMDPALASTGLRAVWEFAVDQLISRTGWWSADGGPSPSASHRSRSYGFEVNISMPEVYVHVSLARRRWSWTLHRWAAR